MRDGTLYMYSTVCDVVLEIGTGGVSQSNFYGICQFFSEPLRGAAKTGLNF